MRFAISTAFQPVDHLIPLARAADELGYHSIAVPDHVVDLEELATPYPYTADGARRWNDANVLALSLRLTSQPVLKEILDAWFAGAPSGEDDDRANVAHLEEIR